MNSLVLATKISWTLQSAIGIAFAAALIGLAVQLKRPAAASLAIAWVAMVVSLLASTAIAFLDPSGNSTLNSFVYGCIVLGAVGASVPAFRSAASRLTGQRETRQSALTRTVFRWTAIGAAFGAIVVAIGSGPLADVPWFVGITGRLVIVGVYALLTIDILRVRAHAAPAFRAVLLLLALAAAVQAIRPIVVVFFVTRDVVTTITDAAALSFIGTHVFTVSIFGVASLLVAIAEERAASVATGRQLREAALRVERSHRLESVGRLASGVAHDFNNLLTVISSSVELARDARANDHAVDEELAEIEKAAGRGAALTAQLLAFARQQPQHVVQFDVSHRVREMTSMLERLVGQSGTLSVIAPATPHMVTMDPVRFEQIVLNLVANARNALTVAGVISISVSHTTIESRATTDGDLTAGLYVALAVKDNGRGIATDDRDNLFEPFFTTRQSEGGTGLGLATVQGIVRQAGGDVTVESEVGRGATFTVLIPAQMQDSARFAG